MSLSCFPLSFGSIRLTDFEEMSFEDFQDGCHCSHLSWISEGRDFGNSESLCPFDASHQVSAQSDLQFGDVI